MLNKQKLKNSFRRAALSYDEAAVLQREVADRLMAHLDPVNIPVQRLLDIGCGTGYCTRALASRYAGSEILALDLADTMVQRAKATCQKHDVNNAIHLATGDAHALPVAADSMDLVFSSLVLQWCIPGEVFAEAYRVLRPGGLFMFATFGPDTLRELRLAWASVDDDIHVHEFIDMHHLGDGLVAAGFADPVMDVDRLTLTYPGVREMLLDLKAIGATNAAQSRSAGMMGPARFRRFCEAYEKLAQNGLVPATYEVIYGHAWAPEQKQYRDTSGETRVPLSTLKSPGE